MAKTANVVDLNKSAYELKLKNRSKKLSEEQVRFFTILGKFPTLTAYWNIDTLEFDIEKLKHDLPRLGEGLSAMARFLAGVWVGDNVLGFDIFRHSRSVDRESEKIIQEWVNDPFYP